MELRGRITDRSHTEIPLQRRDSHQGYVTVTLITMQRCLWCGGLFRVPAVPGRPQLYCRRSHRQRAYEARQLARRHGLGKDDVLMSRKTVADLQDALYVLESALEDVDSDLAEANDTDRHTAALWHLYGATAGLRAMRLEPKAVGAGPD